MVTMSTAMVTMETEKLYFFIKYNLILNTILENEAPSLNISMSGSIHLYPTC